MTLPDRRGTFARNHTGFELTAAGRESIITRLEENVAKNAERWKQMPQLADVQELGPVKPGAVALLNAAGFCQR